MAYEKNIPLAGLFNRPVALQGVAIAPDGSQVAMLYLQEGQAYLSLLAVDPPRLRMTLPFTLGRPGGLAWSPDGTRLAFYAPSGPGQITNDIYVVTLQTWEIDRVTANLHGRPHIPGWSPDSRYIAFSSYEPPIRPTHPPSLYQVDVATGSISRLTFSQTDDRFPQFSPDGAFLVFRRDGDLWRIDSGDRKETQITFDGGYEIGYGCFSPDGSQVVCRRNEGDVHPALKVDVATGKSEPLAPLEAQAQAPCWSLTTGNITYVQQQRLVTITPEGMLQWEAALPDRCLRVSPSQWPRWAARADILAVIDDRDNLWLVRPEKALQQLTFVPEREAPRHTPVPISYTGYGGAAVPALLFMPPEFQKGCSRCLLWIHGGPFGTSAWEDVDPYGFGIYIQKLVSAGMLVLAPDYRGSGGHGAAWEQLLPDEAGVFDLEDVVAGREYLRQEGLATADNVGIVGYSYGGLLTLLALTKYPDHWVGGASLWGVLDARRSNPQRNSTHREDPAWLAERSPLHRINRIAAPLLLLHGVQDTLATVEEVRHIEVTLRQRGISCEARIYEDDGHGLNRYGQEASDLLTAFFQACPRAPTRLLS